MASVFTVESPDAKKLRKLFFQLSKSGMKRVYRRSASKIETALSDILENLVSTWDHTPSQTLTTKVTRSNMVTQLTIDDDPFFWVSVGTKRHKINAKNAAVLSFPWGGRGSYIAKSQKGLLGARAGSGRFTGPTVSFASVNHPGIKARNFDVTIAKAVLPLAVDIISKEIERELARL